MKRYRFRAPRLWLIPIQTPSVRIVQDLGLAGEPRSDDEITVPVNFSLLRVGLVPEGNSAPTVPYYPFSEVTHIEVDFIGQGIPDMISTV